MRKVVLSASVCAVFALFLGIVTSCGSSSGGGASTLTLAMKSSTLTRAPGRAACTVTVNGGPQNGNCFTPYSVSAYFSKASLSSTGGGQPVRLLGGGNKYSGLDDIFRKELMDLRAVPNVDGDDNIQDGTASSYNLIGFDVRSVEMVFQATVAGAYYHVINFFVEQPPSVGSVFSGCGLDAGTTTEMDAKGRLFTGISARRGDILVCKKATATETCAPGDYQWVDGAGTLHATRPGAPQQHTGGFLTSADTCSNTGGRPDINWGGLNLYFGLTTPVTVSAAIASGVKNYTFTSAGETKTGSKLKVNIDADLSGAIFADPTSTITDLAVVSEGTLLTEINKLTLKSIFVEKTKASASTADAAAQSATVTFELL